jgi:hypothetical protein
VAEQSFGLTRMAPAEVDDLLAAGGKETQPAGIDPDSIPTLTEFLSPVVDRVEPRRKTGLTARG